MQFDNPSHSVAIFVKAWLKIDTACRTCEIVCFSLYFCIKLGKVNAAIIPIIPRVIKTSARVKAMRLREKWEVKCEKTESENRLNFLPNIRNLFSGMHRSCFGRSALLCRQIYFKLYPSLKFLSSHNSLRNFFSPSRGEIKMFRLTKLKISTIFLNKPNFLNRKRLCLFVFWFPTFFSVVPSGGGQWLIYY